MGIYSIDVTFYEPSIGHVQMPGENEEDAANKVIKMLQDDGAEMITIERVQYVRSDAEHVEYLKKLI